MKIYLYLQDRILTFTIPVEASGSFSFDEDSEADRKLINVEAREGKWFIYAAKDSSIIYDNNMVSEAPLLEDAFYVIKRNEVNYLISTASLRDKTLSPYYYNNEISIFAGNSNTCNLIYNCPYVPTEAFTIKYADNKVILNRGKDTLVYVNNQALYETSRYLCSGDVIALYSLRILVLPELLLINNPRNTVVINQDSAHLRLYHFPPMKDITSIDIKDEDLYKKEDFFSKAPRLRRTIEEKTISLDKPPADTLGKEMPMILTLGPMLTMGLMSIVTLINTGQKLYYGDTTIESAWPSLAMAAVMLISMLGWPLIINLYNKRYQKKQQEKINKKYNEYLNDKRRELEEEKKLQKNILIENLITVEECLKIIQNKNINFWDKRIDQNDFLVARIGMGKSPLKVKIEYPKDGFTIDENDLKKQADNLVEEYQYIDDVPVGYSFYENKITAIMSTGNKNYYFMNNVLLQLLTFYSYEDLKIVVFTKEEKKEQWSYLKYLNHTFSNDKSIRFFACNNEEEKSLAEYLSLEVNKRLNIETETAPKPYYLIIVDDYDNVKRFEFLKNITETDKNIGFSIVFIENRLSNLPSKCNNFISLGEKSSGVLQNSYEKQEQTVFYDEINYQINMMEVAKAIANVPIEFENAISQLPESITFMEMEKAGKVKQLNIFNRWNTNDTTTSLKAEIGTDTEGDLVYLDLHEKAHGPHGLIAGMTGSGKSEFIITYILSMAINYSPDDVSFVLIDYKGGGLAFAFENKATNIVLPHLAGTITNLDKAEMDRTLVSIDSEVKRRQKAFNEVRDNLGETTIDIYKYQRLYKEGKIKKPIPHLFIICDEFAELKSQQPDFMDNLISIARIGRSLGVHLILATQKPSGVVNDQIWSNSKFHICLKVQDEQDSNEMLKRPDAANLKQTGRFFLQVGYNEYFVLGQSAWCGAKYYPSEEITKVVDKSVDFINDIGAVYKKIQASTGKMVEAKGDQITAILKEVIDVAEQCHKRVDKLWLENIPETILLDNLVKKYNLHNDTNDIEAIIGEYDAPENQEQGLLKYSLLNDGNMIIYGSDGAEREMVLNSIIYSTVTRYKSNLINYYILDYGSQTFRRFDKLNHVGGVVVIGEEEKYNNLFKMLKEEIEDRKKVLAEYGGDFSSYLKSVSNPLPLKVIIMNNYDAINESDKNLYDNFPGIIRDSERYGFIFILTASAMSSVPRKVSQSCSSYYALRLNDESDYLGIFSVKKKLIPRNLFGRGVYQAQDILHEFQTASIVENKESLNEFLDEKFISLNKENSLKAKKIPCVPEQVTIDYVEDKIKTLKNVPLGIDKNTIEVAKYNFLSTTSNVITASKIGHTTSFVRSLIEVLLKIENTSLIVFDGQGNLSDKKDKIVNYYNDNFLEITDKITEYINNLDSSKNAVIFINGLDKYISKLSPTTSFENLLKAAKQKENVSIVICEEIKKIKSYAFETWYTNYINVTDGIYVGTGVGDQTLLRINNYQQELMKPYKNNIIFNISEGEYKIIKAIEFETVEEEEEE